MNELSVNISGSERDIIKSKAIDLFFKTAKARHPDEDFCKNLTKRVFEDALNKYTEFTKSEIFSELPWVEKYYITTKLARLELPNNLRVLALNAAPGLSNNLLVKNFYLSDIDEKDLVIPLEFEHNGKTIFPFSNYGKSKLTLSPEIVCEINEYNSKMEETYSELEKQLRALLAVISECKTTKAFYANLPNLTSLFPKSLQLKIQRKNDTGKKELTEQEKLMQDATNSIATATLLED